MPLIYIWHALKTARKVLGADMPSAPEAEEYELKVEQVLNEGLKQLAALGDRDGLALRPNAFLEAVKDTVKRCQ